MRSFLLWFLPMVLVFVIVILFLTSCYHGSPPGPCDPHCTDPASLHLHHDGGIDGG